MRYLIVSLAFLGFLSINRPAAALTNAKTGIALGLPGATEGTDYVVEQLYYDPLYDDRSVVYIKQSANVSLAHNSDNIDPKGRVIGDAGRGVIRFKIDGDELWEGDSGRGNAQPYARAAAGYRRHRTVRRYSHPFRLSSVVDGVGDNHLSRTDWDHFHKGVRDAFGDIWHTLTYWDDDSTWFPGTAAAGARGLMFEKTSDGKIVQFVVSPRTPAISFRVSGSNQYYTTPPKTYYIPKIHPPTTYMTRGVGIRLVNLTNSKPVYFSFDGRRYRRFPKQAETLAALMNIAGRAAPRRDTAYTLYYKNGRDGRIKRRVLVFDPASPTKGKEDHPKLFWRTQKQRRVLRRRLGRSPYARGYATLKTSATYTKSDLDFHSGRRFWGKSGAGGWRSHREVGHAAVNNGFVAAVEGYGYDNRAYANRAKSALLAAFTIDPIGDENPMAAAYTAPSQDRVYYGFERRNHIAFAAGYDLMADYTTANGYVQGFTPIEEYKVRDNLASEALQLLHRRDSERGRGNWVVGNDLSLPVFAMAMPTYNTPYYGTAGADTPAAGYSGPTPATYYNTPFPNQRITWWEATTNRKVATSGYPNLKNKWSLFTYFASDGLWKEGHLGQYNRHLYPYITALMNFRANYDGGRYPNLEAHANGVVYNRHPQNGKSLASANGSSDRNESVLALVNKRWRRAGLYRWHLDTPSRVAVNYENAMNNSYNLAYNLAFFDDTVVPRAPRLLNRVTRNTATFLSDPDSARAVFGRLQGQDFNDIDIRWVGQASDFMIDAFGENLLVRPGSGWGKPLSAKAVSPEGYNTILVDDTKSSYQTGVTGKSLARLSGLAGRRLALATVTVDKNGDRGPYGAKRIKLTRTVAFVDRRFFILSDYVRSATGRHRYGLTLHGSTDGDERRLLINKKQASARWQKAGGVRLLARFIAPRVAITRHMGYSSITDKLEPYTIASAKGRDVRFITALIPLRPGKREPSVRTFSAAGELRSGGRGFMFDSGAGGRLRRLPGGYATDAETALMARQKDRLDSFMVVGGRRFNFNGRSYLNASSAIDGIYSRTSTGMALTFRARRRARLVFGGLKAGARYYLTAEKGRYYFIADKSGRHGYGPVTGRGTVIVRQSSAIGGDAK